MNSSRSAKVLSGDISSSPSLTGISDKSPELRLAGERLDRPKLEFFSMLRRDCDDVEPGINSNNEAKLHCSSSLHGSTSRTSTSA